MSGNSWPKKVTEREATNHSWDWLGVLHKSQSQFFAFLLEKKPRVCSGSSGALLAPSAPPGPCSDPQTALNLELLGPMHGAQIVTNSPLVLFPRGTSPFPFSAPSPLRTFLTSQQNPKTRVVADCRRLTTGQSSQPLPLPTPFSDTCITLVIPGRTRMLGSARC